MLRNLKMRNGLPFSPIRFWRKKIGPELSTLIITATTTRTGSRTINPMLAIRRSTARFSIETSPPVPPHDAAQRIGHAVDVVCSQPGKEWERDDALPFGARLRQVAGAYVVQRAVIA